MPNLATGAEIGRTLSVLAPGVSPLIRMFQDLINFFRISKISRWIYPFPKKADFAKKVPENGGEFGQKRIDGFFRFLDRMSHELDERMPKG